jgi:hypothetical protein
VPADEEAEELVEPARLRVMGLAEAEVPFAHDPGPVAGRTEQVGERALVER